MEDERQHRGEPAGNQAELPGGVRRASSRGREARLRRGGRGLRAGAHRRAAGRGAAALPRRGGREARGDLRPPVDAAGRAGGAHPAAGPPVRPAAARGRTPSRAIAFVLRSQKRTASRLKLKRLLLYTLRTLILLALPIALARPELRRDARRPAARARARRPPPSCSMPRCRCAGPTGTLALRARPERGARRARGPARRGAGHGAALRPRLAQPPAAPGFDRARAARAARRGGADATAPADLSRCLELAARALEESPLAGKRLVVVSDFTARLAPPGGAAAHGEGPARRARCGRRWCCATWPSGKALPNHALVDLKVEPALQVGPARVPVHLHRAELLATSR